MAYIDQIQLPSGSYYDLQGVEYIVGTQTAATNAWKGITKSKQLYVGKMIMYYLPVAGNSSAATLTLTLDNGNGEDTAAIALRRKGSATMTTHYVANDVLLLVYDGTYWRHDADYDTNNYNQLRDTGRWATKSALYRYMLCMTNYQDRLVPANNVSNSTKTNKTITTETFNPWAPIRYYNSTVSVSAGSVPAASTLYIASTMSLSYSFNTNALLTTYRPVYLVASAVNTTATESPVQYRFYSTPVTQSLPTTDNGLIYIYLGVANSTAAIDLFPVHPVYRYSTQANGIVPFMPHSNLASTAQYAVNASTAAYASTAEYAANAGMTSTYSLQQVSSDGHQLAWSGTGVTATTFTIPDNNTTYDLSTIAGTLSVAKGGTGATNATDACANLKAIEYFGMMFDDDIPQTVMVDTHRQFNPSTVELATKDCVLKRVPTLVTTAKNGIMSSTDKAKLDTIASSANNYTHPTFTAATAGPAANATLTHGGTFTVPYITRDTNGHANNLTNRTFQLPTDNNTTYDLSTIAGTLSVAKGGTGATNAAGARTNLEVPSTAVVTTAAAGLMSSTDKAKLDSIASSATNYTHPTFTAATAGPTENTTLTHNGTVSIPYITRDSNGHIGTLTERTIQLPAGGGGGDASGDYLPVTGGTVSGDVTLIASAATDSKSLIFQRGTLSDNYNDWRIQDRAGFLYFDQRGQGSTQWANQVVFNTSGNISAVSFSGSGASLTSLNANNLSSGTVAVARGGTGATSAADARTNLGAASTATFTGDYDGLVPKPSTRSQDLFLTSCGTWSSAPGDSVSFSQDVDIGKNEISINGASWVWYEDIASVNMYGSGNNYTIAYGNAYHILTNSLLATGKMDAGTIKIRASENDTVISEIAYITSAALTSQTSGYMDAISMTEDGVSHKYRIDVDLVGQGTTVTKTDINNIDPYTYISESVSGGSLGSVTLNSTSNLNTGAFSLAEGSGSTASGGASHAEGVQTYAHGDASHAEGAKTYAISLESHAGGYASTSSGLYSFTHGYYVASSAQAQVVFGKNNIIDDSSAFIFGNGSGTNSRSNAIQMDWNGNTTFSGTVAAGSNATTANQLLRYQQVGRHSFSAPSAVTCSNGSNVTLASTAINIKGIILINFHATFANSTTGIRRIYLTSSSDATHANPIDRSCVYASAGGADVRLGGMAIINTTTISTFPYNVYFRCYQNSGSSMSVTPALKTVVIKALDT